MKKKKALLLVLCAILLVAGSVLGTLAFLTKETGAVTNTFVTGKLFDPTDGEGDNKDPAFVLKEHLATADSAGVYTIADGAVEVTSQTYTVLPGVDIKKDPFVRFDDALVVDAYVFVEIVNNLPDVMGYEAASGWTEVTGMTGSNGGKVYTLGVVTKGNELGETHILKDDTVTVADAEISFTAGTGDTLVFYGYMIQSAGFDTAAAAAAGLGFTSASPTP